jgi:GGDEF domain-containing protein
MVPIFRQPSSGACPHRRTPGSVGTLLDISVQKAAEQRIRELADYDVLTGLPNRRLLRERFVQLVAAAERDKEELAVIFLDLDHFKRVNDSLGHSVGDELLCEVARRLDSVVRRRYPGPPGRR